MPIFRKLLKKGPRSMSASKLNTSLVTIDIGSEKEYLGNTSAEALELARARHPNKVFYVVKIGFDVVETMAKSYVEKH
jgi:hypothetical protein